ncbi:unnamed protein product [Cylicocyclus nassatus]|uniref:SH2 domain-containing protein n=1 Tax=Cylicocyclus nassatus TaxID=53992 RepID=A0AA36GNH6_CYLNA|nr:unnamed protein product [Cylicocyclus nassatus]
MDDQPSTSSSPTRSWAKRLAELKACPWYWGDLSWRNAEKLLLLCEEGSFLVRDSHSENHLFTISYKHGNKVLHSRVEISGQYAHLGGPLSLERSESVVELLKHAVQISFTRERDILIHRRASSAVAVLVSSED